MPKYFPLVRTVTISAGQGVTFDIGSDTQQDSVVLENTFDIGEQNQDDVFEDSNYTLPIGEENQDDVVSVELDATFPQGSDSQSQGVISLFRDVTTGSETESKVVSCNATLSQHTTSATAVTPDTPAWGSVTNAQGVFNDTEASVSNPTGLDTSQDATLRCAGLVVGSTPSGFTRNAVGIRIRHRWDLTIIGAIAGVIDVTASIDLRDSANVLIANLSTRLASGGAGTQATLIIEDFDISGLVTEPQLAAGVKIDFRIFTTGVFTSTINGNYSWQVDGCYLTADYSRVGIT